MTSSNCCWGHPTYTRFCAYRHPPFTSILTNPCFTSNFAKIPSIARGVPTKTIAPKTPWHSKHFTRVENDTICAGETCYVIKHGVRNPIQRNGYSIDDGKNVEDAASSKEVTSCEGVTCRDCECDNHASANGTCDAATTARWPTRRQHAIPSR